MEFYNQLLDLFLFFLICLAIIVPLNYLAANREKNRKKATRNGYKDQTNLIHRTGGKTRVVIRNNEVVEVNNFEY